jgi:hypothetical protein
MDMSNLLQEAIEEVRVLGLQLREESQALRDQASALRAHSSALRQRERWRGEQPRMAEIKDWQGSGDDVEEPSTP